MPSLVFPIAHNGVLVPIVVRPSELQTKRLRDAGMSVPESVQTIGFIDTGACPTLLDSGLVQKMKAANGFSLGILGTGGQTTVKGYEVEIAVVDLDHEMRWFPLVAGARPISGSGALAALGRDFLAHFRLVYDGPAGQATLSWE
jgi:hypothetical protein